MENVGKGRGHYFLPCLFERWRASADGHLHHGARSTSEDVRNDVRLNLESMLNTEAPRLLRDLMLNSTHPRVVSGEELPAEVRSSVLCFGVPAYSGLSQSGMAPDRIAEDLRQCILRFEPRIDANHFEVRPLDSRQRDRFLKLQFSIHGLMWPKPLQEFDFRTEVDLKSGRVSLIA
jgi:type VI secretion system protein ImpF